VCSFERRMYLWAFVQMYWDCRCGIFITLCGMAEFKELCLLNSYEMKKEQLSTVLAVSTFPFKWITMASSYVPVKENRTLFPSLSLIRSGPAALDWEPLYEFFRRDRSDNLFWYSWVFFCQWIWVFCLNTHEQQHAIALLGVLCTPCHL